MEKPWMQTAAFFLAAAFFLLRFGKWKTVLFWSLLYLCFAGSRILQMPEEPEAGIYTITSIRTGYAIAEKGRQKVVVYQPEEYELDQSVDLDGFEPVHSLHNTGLFSFSSYLNARGITCSASHIEKTTSQKQSLKRRIWRFISDAPASSLYHLLFYGITDSEELEWIGQLGLPIMALTALLRSLLERFFYPKTAGWLLIALQGLILILFPVSESSVRLLFFSLGPLLFSRWNLRWPFSLTAFLLVMPFSAAGMSLILPAGVSFFMHFQPSGTAKKIIQILWCALIQILFLGKINLLLLCGFMLLRRLTGWFFLLSLPGLWIPFWGHLMEKAAGSLQISMEWCTITGFPPYWYLGLLLAGFWLLAWKWKVVRAVFSVALLCLYPFVWRLDPFFHVYQIDVGQGDSALIVEPYSRSAVMIDAAGRFNHNNASELFIPFLKSRQIQKLDALIVTHPDFDHNGSVESLSQQFPVNQIVETYEQLPQLTYPFFLLLEERTVEDSEDKNDQSLISYFSYDGFRYLWMADASVRIEKQLLEVYELETDFLKLGHHGSDTSSGKAFLQKTSPQLALISSGFQNRYGHPSLEVLKNLDEAGIDRINTADHGMIHIQTFHGIAVTATADGLMAIVRAENQ